jgi:hypothetical protein
MSRSKPFIRFAESEAVNRKGFESLAQPSLWHWLKVIFWIAILIGLVQSSSRLLQMFKLERFGIGGLSSYSYLPLLAFLYGA